MRPRGVAAVALIASAAAAFGCGQVTVVPADAGGDQAGPDGQAGADRASGCPIAACAAALRAVQDACPTAGVSCVSTTEQRQVNDCFANGVRVGFDYRTDLSLASATVVGSNGRVCYSVSASPQVIGTIFVVSTAAGEPIISEYYRAGLDSTFSCPDGATLMDGPARPCGELRTLPEDRFCIDGLCVRP